MNEELKAELRRLNIEAWTNRKDISREKLDASLKKNTSFVKKLKVSLTSEKKNELIRDIKSLKLEKYIAEVVVSISEAKLKNTSDINTAVEICSLLHQRFADFSPLLQDALMKQLTPPPPTPANSSSNNEQKEKEDNARIIRQRIVLRLFVELYLVNIFKDFSMKERDMLLYNILKKLLTHDKTAHVNISLAVTFMKYYGEELTGIIPQKIEEDKDKENESPKETVHTITIVNDGKKNDSAVKKEKESFIPIEVKTCLKNFILDYCKAIENQLIKGHDVRII